MNIVKKICWVFSLLSVFFVPSVMANSGVYAGGPVYIHRDYSINELKNSGFTYVIVWTIHIDSNGNMNFNGEFPLVENGNYVGNSRYPNFPADIASLKQGTTSINRVEFSLSGWGSGTFANIRNLVNAQGTGSGSILYRNFQALRNAIPSVDAINFDDESEYDVGTATRFAVMLADLGYKITLVPYTRAEFWTALASNTNAQRPGTVDRVDLQVYAGGGGNNPCHWDFGAIPIYPGMWSNEASPASVQSRMNDWKNSCGHKVKGGFMWLYDDFDNSGRVQEYSSAINNVFPPVVPPASGRAPVMRAFGDCHQSGWEAVIPPGHHDLSYLQGLGFVNDGLSSFWLAPGWKTQLYWDSAWRGQELFSANSQGCLVSQGFNDQASSLRVTPNGDQSLSGRFYIRNRKSGLYVDVANFSQDDGGNLLQWNFHGGTNQQFDFEHLGDGVYVIRSVVSGKAMDIDGISTSNGANVHQWAYVGGDNQKFIAHKEGQFHQLIALHSNRVVEVANGSMEPDANVQQWDNNNQITSYWELVPVR
ncbi:Extracellular exo-alpha-L-arabinofuranosidase [Thalassocella blandensis]|nr:Extracellular exo-alpha-L-arabinofuranosidase [Thalassocella blandensis]